MATTLDQTAEVLPKQKRSRARRAEMIEVGRRLLMDRDFEEISVAEITGALGYSTGSFYSAFADKAAFFVAIQRSVSEASSASFAKAIAPAALAGKAPADRLALCVDLTLDYFRQRRGVIGSALRHESRLPEAWAPHRASARRVAAALTDGLSPADAKRLRVAIQMVFGTLVNALLHDPGPLRLEDGSIGEELKAALRPYLNERKD